MDGLGIAVPEVDIARRKEKTLTTRAQLSAREKGSVRCRLGPALLGCAEQAREGVRRADTGTGIGRHAGLRPERGGEGKRPSGQLDRRGNKADGPNLRKGEGNSFPFFKPFSKPI